MLELMVLIPVEKGSIVGEFIICIESFGALCPVVFSIPIYLFCQTSCSLSNSTSGGSKACPSSCNSSMQQQKNDTVIYTTVCYNNHGNIDNHESGKPFKIDGKVVDTTTLQTCGGCKESGASTLHAGVVGVLLGSIALAFMS